MSSVAAGTPSFSINGTGQIAGALYNDNTTKQWIDAAVWQPDTANGSTGTWHALPDPTGMAITANAWDINDAGLIVGEVYVDKTYRTLPVIWAPSVPNGTDYTATLLSSTSTGGNAAFINNQGVAIVSLATIYRWTTDDGLLAIRDLLAPGESWTSMTADALNDYGQIIATASDNGTLYSVMLQPIPEPTIVAPVLAGAYLLRRRRRVTSQRPQ